MIEIRKLAAIDVAFLGARFVVTEFVIGVFRPLALGGFILLRSHSLGQVALAAYFLSLAINYVPLLLYAISIARRKSARAEVADELVEGQGRAMRMYRRQSLLLLLPLVVPALALGQERRKARAV